MEGVYGVLLLVKVVWSLWLVTLAGGIMNGRYWTDGVFNAARNGAKEDWVKGWDNYIGTKLWVLYFSVHSELFQIISVE